MRALWLDVGYAPPETMYSNLNDFEVLVVRFENCERKPKLCVMVLVKSEAAKKVKRLGWPFILRRGLGPDGAYFKSIHSWRPLAIRERLSSAIPDIEHCQE